ncbi:YtxH domain-containing protein, partial [Maribellus luteus]
MTGIILGSLIGAAAALLSSPKSGREVRTLLDERTAPTRQRLTEQTQVVREKAEPLVGEWIQIA